MKLRITVEGTTYDVDVEVLEGGPAGASTITAPPPIASVGPANSAPGAMPARPSRLPAGPTSGGGASGGADTKVCKAPIAGNVVAVKVKSGDGVAINQVLVVMEAMKMETNIASPVAAKVKAVLVKPGDAVKAGQILVEFE